MGAVRDLESSALTEPEKSLLRFVRKVNHRRESIQDADIAALHEQGFSDEAIYDAISVCALFNFYNRWVDGSGVSDLPAEAYQQTGKRMARDGYAR